MARAEIPLTIIDPATGNAIVGASVAVKLRATGVSAVVYAAETGATTVTNPRTSDAYGRVSGWVDRGAYQFDISGTGLTSYTEFWDAATSSDGGLDTAWLADGAVTSAKILDGTIATADIADAAVTPAKLAANSRCKIYNSTAQSIPDQTFTALTFDSEVYDTGLHSTSSNTSRITITQAGTYVFTAQLQYDGPPLGSFVLAGIYKNGTAGTSGVPLCIDRQAPTTFQPHLLAVVDSVAAGDYVQVFVYHDRGSSVSLKAPTITITSGVVSASSSSSFLPPMFSAQQLS